MSKRIIFDVGHPGQVHQFKNIYLLLEKKGWECLFVAKDKDITIQLLEGYNLNYKLLAKNKKGLLKKIMNLPYDYYSFYKIVKQFKPDFVLSRFSIHSAHICKMLSITNIAFSDTEHTSLFHKITLPYVNIKFTGDSYLLDLGKNHFRYNANIELFYLHPSIFKPDISILDELNLSKDDKFVIVRFVSWDAHHDIGEKGFSNEYKIKLVSELEKNAKVFITSEGILPKELEKFRIQLKPNKIHDLMSFATMYIGEGGTMASEAACLGVPSIYVNSLDAGVFHDEIEYGLLHSFRDSNGVTEKATAILNANNIKEEYKLKLNKFLEEKINVTKYLEWFIENYPESKNKIMSDHLFQLNFK